MTEKTSEINTPTTNHERQRGIKTFCWAINASVLALSTAGGISADVNAASENNIPDERYLLLPGWKCDAGRADRFRTLESDANVRPNIAVGDGQLAVTYQRRETNDNKAEDSPIFSTVIFEAADFQAGTVLTYYSDDCAEHVPQEQRNLPR